MAGRALAVPPRKGIRPAETAPELEPDEEQILALGQMIADTETSLQLLRELVYSGQHFQGNLRVVRGCCKRTIERATAILKDGKPA